MTTKMLSLAKVCERIDRSKPTVRQWLEEGRFPQGVPDASGVLFWAEDVIEAWQLLAKVGFFRWPVKENRTENLGKRRETLGRSDEPQGDS